ncbi:hypothetical protein MTsPCn5_14970 [Croceitalea sp. MTPC5]|nr:hypothetical protein MTsPCn5_14970 [Croceitalea sp. MTPC5]
MKSIQSSQFKRTIMLVRYCLEYFGAYFKFKVKDPVLRNFNALLSGVL